jgi:hypothetical protein
LYQAQGDLEQAAQCLREAAQVLNTSTTPKWVHPAWLAQKASLLAAQGNLQEAEAALKSAGILAEAPSPSGRMSYTWPGCAGSLPAAIPRGFFAD